LILFAWTKFVFTKLCVVGSMFFTSRAGENCRATRSVKRHDRIRVRYVVVVALSRVSLYSVFFVENTKRSHSGQFAPAPWAGRDGTEVIR